MIAHLVDGGVIGFASRGSDGDNPRRAATQTRERTLLPGAIGFGPNCKTGAGIEPALLHFGL
jgi:hypothetical protein